MKKLLFLTGFVALVSGAHGANLISDGGFEIGDVAAPQFAGSPWTTEYGYADNNSTSGPNSIWNEGFMRVMDSDKAANNATTGHALWDPVIRSEGHSFLAVNGSTQLQNQPFVLSQVFSYAGTGPLQVSLDLVNLYKPNSEGASTLSVYLDDVHLGTASTQLDNVWRTAVFSGTVVDTGSHTLKIVADTTQQSGNDFGLDDIAVTPVPEPFTMGLAGLALAAAAIRRRRNSG